MVCPQARPDYLLIARHLLLFASELKKAEVGILKAIEDLRKKFKPGLPAAQYGNLPFLLAAAQSGCQIQYCCIDNAGKVSICGIALALDSTCQEFAVSSSRHGHERLLAGCHRHAVLLSIRSISFVILHCLMLCLPGSSSCRCFAGSRDWEPNQHQQLAWKGSLDLHPAKPASIALMHVKVDSLVCKHHLLCTL